MDVLLSSVKEIRMSNIYLKGQIDKNWRDALKTSIFQIWKVRLQVIFLGGPTHAVITKF